VASGHRAVKVDMTYSGWIVYPRQPSRPFFSSPCFGNSKHAQDSTRRAHHPPNGAASLAVFTTHNQTVHWPNLIPNLSTLQLYLVQSIYISHTKSRDAVENCRMLFNCQRVSDCLSGRKTFLRICNGSSNVICRPLGLPNINDVI